MESGALGAEPLDRGLGVSGLLWRVLALVRLSGVSPSGLRSVSATLSGKIFQIFLMNTLLDYSLRDFDDVWNVWNIWIFLMRYSNLRCFSVASHTDFWVVFFQCWG
jgi:hypothetical protein